MAKKVDYQVNFKKDENRDAVADVLKNGRVEVGVNIRHKNINITWRFDSIEEAIKELKKIGYEVQ